jgi:hypothetical protein
LAIYSGRAAMKKGTTPEEGGPEHLITVRGYRPAMMKD